MLFYFKKKLFYQKFFNSNVLARVSLPILVVTKSLNKTSTIFFSDAAFFLLHALLQFYRQLFVNTYDVQLLVFCLPSLLAAFWSFVSSTSLPVTVCLWRKSTEQFGVFSVRKYQQYSDIKVIYNISSTRRQKSVRYRGTTALP